VAVGAADHARRDLNKRPRQRGWAQVAALNDARLASPSLWLQGLTPGFSTVEPRCGLLVADQVLDLLSGGSSIAGELLMHRQQIVPARRGMAQPCGQDDQPKRIVEHFAVGQRKSSSGERMHIQPMLHQNVIARATISTLSCFWSSGMVVVVGRFVGAA